MRIIDWLVISLSKERLIILIYQFLFATDRQYEDEARLAFDKVKRSRFVTSSELAELHRLISRLESFRAFEDELCNLLKY